MPSGLESPVGAEMAWRRTRTVTSQWTNSLRFSTHQDRVGVRVYVGSDCSTANIGLHAPAAPPLYLALREGGCHCHKRWAPLMRVWIEIGCPILEIGVYHFHINGDHISNIFLLDLHISYLTFNLIIHLFTN
jgi:hypothetical protein